MQTNGGNCGKCGQRVKGGHNAATCGRIPTTLTRERPTTILTPNPLSPSIEPANLDLLQQKIQEQIQTADTATSRSAFHEWLRLSAIPDPTTEKTRTSLFNEALPYLATEHGYQRLQDLQQRELPTALANDLTVIQIATDQTRQQLLELQDFSSRIHAHAETANVILHPRAHIGKNVRITGASHIGPQFNNLERQLEPLGPVSIHNTTIEGVVQIGTTLVAEQRPKQPITILNSSIQNATIKSGANIDSSTLQNVSAIASNLSDTKLRNSKTRTIDSTHSVIQESHLLYAELTNCSIEHTTIAGEHGDPVILENSTVKNSQITREWGKGGGWWSPHLNLRK